VDGYLDERNQAFLALSFGQGPLDFEIDYGERTVHRQRNPSW